MLSKVKSTAEVYMRLLTQIIELVMECSNTLEIFMNQSDVELKTIIPAFYRVSVSLEEYVRSALGKNPFGLGCFRWTQGDAVSEIKVIFFSTSSKMYL